jgi:hypothetical protein
MKKYVLFAVIVMLSCAGLVSAQTALRTWSINEDWARNDPDGMGPENTWQVHGDDTAALAAPFVDTTENYAPVYIAGYAAGNRAMFKAYTDPNADTEAEKPAGHPADTGSGILDLGDVGSISPNQLCFTTWQVPRDMIIQSTLTMYSVGSSSSEVHFLVRDHVNGPPINPEDIPERAFIIPAFTGTREYVTATLAPFEVTAGQHIMYWHRSNAADGTGIIGISEWIVEEIDPNTMPDPWTDCTDPEDPNKWDPNSGSDYVWEMPRDFSPITWESGSMAQNPFRNWSFGESDSLGDFNLFTQSQAITTPFYHSRWTNMTNPTFGLPNVHRVFSLPAWENAQACDVAGHPAPASDVYSNFVIRWTSPIEAFVGIQGRFGAGVNNTVDCWIHKTMVPEDPNSEETLFEALDAAGTTDAPFGLVANVQVGTTIDFVVGPGSTFGGQDTPMYIRIGESIAPQCEDISTYLPMDFNQDCYVDLQDFATFANEWLKCNHPSDPSCTE